MLKRASSAMVFAIALALITGTLITTGYGYLAGRAGHAIGARMGLLNKVAAVLFAGLAARLITE